MRKFLGGLAIIVIIAALGAGGYAAYSWVKLDDLPRPTPQVLFDGKELTPKHTEWTVPICFGYLTRDFSWDTDSGMILESFTDDFTVDIELPTDFDGIISVNNSQEKTNVFEGDAKQFADFIFPANGNYDINITLKKPENTQQAYGKITYTKGITLDVPPPKPPQPTLKVSSNSVVQGDSLAIELNNVPEGVIPTAKTDLSLTTFASIGEGRWMAFTGIADARDPGEYEISVQFDEFKEIVPVTVQARKFNRQDLTIDTSSPTISEANSNEAYQQFRDTIPPFYETADAKIYWSGEFLQPVQGRLSSEYGLLRYTNGGAKPRRHAGIDLAASAGTVIIAPAAGKVVFSDYLLNTGNTMVIEHGGGLKSYYYHLSKRDVAVDEIVKAGQTIGQVGTTGYSTGPHLHFELRIGSQNLDPFKFFDGTSGCFAL